MIPPQLLATLSFDAFSTISLLTARCALALITVLALQSRNRRRAKERQGTLMAKAGDPVIPVVKTRKRPKLSVRYVQGSWLSCRMHP